MLFYNLRNEYTYQVYIVNPLVTTNYPDSVTQTKTYLKLIKTITLKFVLFCLTVSTEIFQNLGL